MQKALPLLILGFFIAGIVLIIPLTFADTPAITTLKSGAHVRDRHEHHPELQRAIHKLKIAKADLERNKHVSSGHETKAIQAIDHAIEEIRLAVNYDKK